jgi:putative DNA primase/helicase
VENHSTTEFTWQELLDVAALEQQPSGPPTLADDKTWAPRLDYVGVGDEKRATQDDVTLLFVTTIVNDYRYIPERREWIRWTGSRWEVAPSGANEVREALRSFLRGLAEAKGMAAYNGAQKQALAAGKTPDEVQAASKKAYDTVCKTFLSVTYINAIMNLATSDARIVTPIAYFDARADVLNTPGGLVNLRTGEMTPPSPDNLVMRSASVSPQAGPTPRWDKFLHETFGADQSLIDFVQRALGMSLLGAQPEQLFLYLHGEGANGKDTLMNMVQDLIGTGATGYSITIDSGMLVESRYQGHPTEIAQFLGARMAVASEVPKGSRFDTAKIKKLNGSGKLAGRFMRGDFFDFDATHTLWIMANDRLQVPADDKAFFRRLREVPFLHVVPKEQRIAGLDRLIVREEGPQILAWIIEGARRYLSEGIFVPLAVSMANERYQSEQDTVEQWLEANTEADPTVSVPNNVIRAAYLEFCKQEHLVALTQTQLTKRLKELGKVYYNSNGVRGFRGFKLLDVPATSY